MSRKKPTSLRILCSVVVILLSCLWDIKVANGGEIPIRPPFSGSYPVYSWFDHDNPNYSHDNIMVPYTGETHSDCMPPTYYSYCYDGHPGIDFGMGSGTPILAASDGTVVLVQFLSTGYGSHIVIQHANQYRTLYGHLSSINVSNGQPVQSGAVIGYSGNTGNSSGPHLHFGVYRSNYTANEQYATDPYGWIGNGNDPLVSYYSAPPAKCLWRSLDSDPISCSDKILEDGQVGSGFSLGWNQSTIGNSYQLHYRLNDNLSYPAAYAVWGDSSIHGVCKIYAWIPANFATSQQVTYWISGYQSGWLGSVTINQNAYSNKWVYLRSGTFAGTDYPLVYIFSTNTGESVSTKWIAVDAMKFRCYRVYLPLFMRN